MEKMSSILNKDEVKKKVGKGTKEELVAKSCESMGDGTRTAEETAEELNQEKKGLEIKVSFKGVQPGDEEVNIPDVFTFLFSAEPLIVKEEALTVVTRELDVRILKAKIIEKIDQANKNKLDTTVKGLYKNI